MQTPINFNITKVQNSRLDQVDLDDPGFGQFFSDHMLEMEFCDGAWQQPAIKPYGPVEITPALNTLHYGQSVFEGLKAYHVDQDKVNLFRIEKNYERLVRSCQRLCIPTIEREVFFGGIEKLVELDQSWIPRKEGYSLYVRPFVCAWDPVISARVSKTYRFYIITSPVGSYYADPVKLMTSETYTRAVQGGVGEAKTAGNYAASLYPAQVAREQGCDQVLWLDAREHKYVEEVGTMNIFFLINDVLLTPPLGGTILPGVTRDSVIQLARYWGMDVREKRITVDELIAAHEQGQLQEIFGAGTAAVISPVKGIQHQDQQIALQATGRGPVGQKIYDTITAIQAGKADDPFGWIHPIKMDGE